MGELKFEKLFTRVQNGNDVRGAAIAIDTEPRTLSAPLVKFIARAFADYLAEKTGKEKKDLRAGVGHVSPRRSSKTPASSVSPKSRVLTAD